MRARSRVALFATLVALTMGSTACGARLSEDQRALAIQQGGSGTAVNPGAVPSGSAAPGTTGGPQGTTSGTQGTTGGTQGTEGTEGTEGTSTTTGGGPSTSGPDAWSCKATAENNGGKTDVGVSATEIRLANISDISGPVPGLFKSARDASQAFANYFNATYPNGICGRKLVVDTYDSRTDSTSNGNATRQACDKDFGVVGSQSAFDDGGADASAECNSPLVDIPAAAVTSKRQDAPNVHAALSTDVNYQVDTNPKYFMAKKFGSGSANAMQNAAFLYIDAGASRQNGDKNIAAYKKAGVNFKYTAPIPIAAATTQGFKPHVQQMKDKGVKFVQWIGAWQQAVHLAEAMDQSEFYPTVFLVDPTAYNNGYLDEASAFAEKVHTYAYSPAAPLDADIPEVALYREWLQRSGVADEPTFFGQCAWSAMRLFVETAFKVGPKLTRDAMNAALSKVDNWTGNDMHSRQHVGAKRTGEGSMFMRVAGGRWVREAPAGKGYLYGNIIRV